jgi:hypothetical protein
MLGLPVLPAAHWPGDAPVVLLGAQAAADPEVVARLQTHLAAGRLALVTPAFLRRAGPAAQRLAGVEVGRAATPAEVGQVRWRGHTVALARPLEVDATVAGRGARVRLEGSGADGAVPILTERRAGRGRLLVWNLRTFDEADLRAAGEWLLCPKPLGWTELPAPVADALRRPLLAPLAARLSAPAGVGLYLFEDAVVLYNFHEVPQRVRFNGRALDLPPHAPCWLGRR